LLEVGRLRENFLSYSREQRVLALNRGLAFVSARQAERRGCRALRQFTVGDWLRALRKGKAPGSDFAARERFAAGWNSQPALAQLRLPAWEPGLAYFRAPPAQEQADGICGPRRPTASPVLDRKHGGIRSDLGRPALAPRLFVACPFARPEPSQADAAERNDRRFAVDFKGRL